MTAGLTNRLSRYMTQPWPGTLPTLGNGKTEVSQNKQNETKVQSDYLLTYQNSFADGTHNLTATAGFTTYYNSLSGLVLPADRASDW